MDSRQGRKGAWDSPWFVHMCRGAWDKL